MFHYFKSLSDRSKLLSPVALCVAALMAVGALSVYTLERVKVGGPIDTDILNGKDLMADVLPPPMYLVETHLTVQESAGVGDPKRVSEFTEKYTALRKEYDERQAHWVKNLPPGAARDLVTGPLHAAAREYFDVCEKQLVPALQAGNEEKARELANGVLKDKYRAQRAVVDKVVALATAETEAKSKEAATTVSGNTRLMIGLMVCVPLVSCVIAVVIVRTVTGKTTAALERAADFESQVTAMGKAQAVIEFTMDGKVVTANDNFLSIMGYSLLEIQGRHHSTFVAPAHAGGAEYREFWAKLNRGEYVAAEFKRLGKDGREVWLQASYNPILGPDGKPYKVVKFALDISAAKVAQAEAERTRAMIESAQMNVMFADRDMIIRYANPLTIRTLRTLEKHLPIRADELIGKSIDIFHKRPEHQRRLLEDPRNVPPVALIQVGPETLELKVSPVLDSNKNHIGTMVTWAVVTERITMENKVRQQAEVDKAQADDLRKKVDSILVVVNALAAGDFTQHIPDLGTDGVGQMAVALNKAVTSVRTALEGVREVSEQLADASGQLASASEEIATGAQEQASGLEETASTLEQITATVKQNSDSAQQARQLASGSRDVAEKGGSVVGSAVEAMSEINASSKKIAEIITAIDEIAFQTNLLALNAAVEAARAGEQGRGFAVVAAEVRNLAQRSASAAKEIKALIQDSVKKVDAGTELVNKSGATLSEIVNSVKRVTDIVTEIAAASREQSTGIDQVNKAVTQMDSVTQRNASQTEEMSATAQTLTEQAGHLRDLVSRFKLGHGDGGAAHPVVAQKRAKASKPRPAVARAMGRANGRAHELDALGNGNGHSNGHSDDGYTEF